MKIIQTLVDGIKVSFFENNPKKIVFMWLLHLLKI
jgi:hypothetical protein